MATDVKRRKYDSPRRREQASATRQAILSAAQRLFEEDGYEATSVPSIAAEADVAVKTVFVIFETKARLLRQLWLERLAPEDAEVPVLERTWFRQLVEAEMPEQKLHLLARQSGSAKERSGALMEVIRNARTADPEISSLWDDIQNKLLKVQSAVAEQLKDDLADDLDVATATDILWTLNHPSVWHLFVVQRGWSRQRYVRWLERALCRELVREGTP